MGLSRVPTSVLALSSATTPALTTTAGGASSSGGFSAGRQDLTVFLCEVVRGATSMTGVTFAVFGARQSTGPWIALPVYKVSDTAKTLAATATVSASASTTAGDALVCDAAKGFPWLDIKGLAVAANAATGDSCAAYLIAGDAG